MDPNPANKFADGSETHAGSTRCSASSEDWDGSVWYFARFSGTPRGDPAKRLLALVP